jgi:uncharacterized membrane protein
MHLFSVWFLFYIIYSVLGWITETIYCSVQERHFVERGFLRGPLCPIYGAGALILLLVLESVQSWVAIFIIGFLLTSALEYITSYIMEKIFKMRWWDYSDQFLNINGRVCLLNSTLFALMTVILVKVLHPFIERHVANLSENILYALTILLGTLLLVDFILSVRASFRLKGNLEKLKQAQENLKEDLEKHQRELRERISENRKELREQFAESKEGLKEIIETMEAKKDMILAEGKDRIRELRLRLSSSERYILRSFPNMRPTKNNLAVYLEDLRDEIIKSKEHRKIS